MPMENQSTPTVFETIAVIAVVVMYFYLGMHGYLLLAHCGFLIFSAWALFKKRKRIIAARRTIELFVCSAVSFFIVKVLATGHFNRKYGIFKENLDYSSTAWAVCIACTILLCIPLLCHSARFTWRAFQSEQHIVVSLRNAIYAASCLLLTAILSVAYEKAEKQDLWLLWLDAYLYSDCNAPKGSYAVRKNNEACYRFIWKPFQFELREYPSPKP